MKSLARLLMAFLVEGTAAVALALFVFFPLSGASPDDAISTASTRISEGAAWMNDVFAEETADEASAVSHASMIEMPERSEAEVAARLDHAAADLGASLELELDRLFAPLTELDPRAATRAD